MPSEYAPEDSWLSQLSWSDLQLLRGIVRKIYMQYHPIGTATDMEADRIINSLGPQVAERMIKKAVDKGLR